MIALDHHATRSKKMRTGGISHIRQPHIGERSKPVCKERSKMSEGEKCIHDG